MFQENTLFSGNGGAFAFLLHGAVRDPSLPAGMGKAGASSVALRVLLMGIVHAGPDAERQEGVELYLGFFGGRGQCSLMSFQVAGGVKEDMDFSH